MNIDSMIQGNPQALVTSYNGVLVADSLEVADRFGKRHTHVLRSIDDIINQLESQSTQNWADYFIPDDYQDNKNRTQRRFKLTRDGFSLLVMGFTGPAALHWKLLYIEAFNKMEQALRSNIDIRQLVTQITTDVLRTVLPDIRQAVEPPPEIEDGRIHNSRRLDFLYGNDEAYVYVDRPGLTRRYCRRHLRLSYRERESRKRIYTEVAPTLRSSRQGVKVVENTTKSDTEKTPPCSR